MRVIRAERVIHIPHDPENPDTNSMRSVQPGLIALVPLNYSLPENTYKDLGTLDLKKLTPETKKEDKLGRSNHK